MPSTQLLSVCAEIDRLLCEVIAAQRDHVEKLCSKCNTPCCSRVSYLFDEKDWVFAGVLGLNGVPRRRRNGKKGCHHLSPTGCLLEPKARPFTCHRYLCPELKQEMIRKDPKLVSVLEKKFRELEELRAGLLRAFVQAGGIGSRFFHFGRRRRERNQDNPRRPGAECAIE